MLTYLEEDEAILQLAQMHTLKAPDKTNLELLHTWLVTRGMGDGQIQGLEGLAWDDTSDLMALKSPPDERAPFALGNRKISDLLSSDLDS